MNFLSYLFWDRLLNIMEARAGKDEFFSSRGSESYDTFATSEVLDRSSDPQIQMYTTMLRICAATNEKADSSQAVSIAFEIYDKMIQGNIKPGPKTFDSMYTCVKTFLDQHPEAESQALLQKVFKMASKHGVSRGEVLGRYKESLRRSQVAGRAG
jgi:Ca2+-binding EF-hand superfamily protein